MERRLYRGIMMPTMILTVGFGFWLYILNFSTFMHSGWMHAKLSIVMLLVLYHFYCGNLVKQFARDENTHSHVFYRILNELPLLGLIGATILVVVKPF